MKRALVLSMILLCFGALGIGGLLALSYHDTLIEVNKGRPGWVRLSLDSVHLSKTHGLWIFWRMHFPVTTKFKSGDAALWYFHPFRRVEVTKNPG
jgi:hypothetical protein